MPTDVHMLMGEVVADPENEEKNAEKLLMGFLSSLIQEQKMNYSEFRIVTPASFLANPTSRSITQPNPNEEDDSPKKEQK